MVGGDIGCRPLSVTMDDGIGWCQQWTTTPQQGTKCGNCEKATLSYGGSRGDDDDSKEEVVEEDDDNDNGDGNGDRIGNGKGDNKDKS